MLVLLADQLADRRVLMGSLGCANCRGRYPIEDGYCDLRSPPSEGYDLSDVVESAPGDAVTLGALLGVTKGPGEVALLGSLASHYNGAFSTRLGPLFATIHEVVHSIFANM